MGVSSSVVLLLLLVASLGDVNAAKLPASFKRCHRKDDKCLGEALQAVLKQLTKPLPEVGLSKLEPLEIPALTIGAGNGAVAVEQQYKNVKVHGFSTIEVDSASFDFDKKVFILKDRIPEVKLMADYVLNGRILLIPVQGNGPSVHTLEKLSPTLEMPFTEVQKGGKTYLRFKGVKLALNPEHVSYRFDNLFNGDKVLGENVNNVLNDNWKDVYEDVKEGYEEAFGLILENMANSLFSRVPLSEIFLD